MNRGFHVVGWGYVAVCTALVVRALAVGAGSAAFAPAGPAAPAGTGQGGSDAAQWFRRAKPYCNAVEVGTLQQQSPAPPTPDGQGYRAACHALAGQTDAARRVIDALPAAQRQYAAAIVFDVGHPVADAGDDRSAGPIMELVVDYWPDHYMALYHAGMAEYMLGQHDLARRNLRAFLGAYGADDGWRRNALDVLERLDRPGDPAASDRRRPREPGT
jgi:hypothetical protein